MQKTRPIPLKLMIMASLLIAICMILLLAGIRPFFVLVSVAGLGLFFWWFTRKKPPEGELPCASVSCCHYLQEREEKK